MKKDKKKITAGYYNGEKFTKHQMKLIDKYGYSKTKERIEKFDTKASCAFFGGVLFTGLFLVFHMFSVIGNNIAITKTINASGKKFEEARVELQENISSYVKDINDFDLASVEILNNDNNYICKAFGRAGIKSVMGFEQDKYVNLYFNISEQKAQDILDAVAAVKNLDEIKKNESPELSLRINKDKRYKGTNLANVGKIKKAEDACLQVYKAIDEAVKTAYSHKIEEIADSKQFNEKLASNYRYVKNEVMTEVYGLFVHSNFVNSGIMTTGISSIARDKEKNECYFYVDTLQAISNSKPGDRFNDYKLETCRTMVVVEGADLSNEEVYAKFIRGEQKEFLELIRNTNSEKTGIIDNKVEKDVEEIEMLF